MAVGLTRRQIREDVRTRLIAAGIASGRVYANMQAPTEDAELPCVGVYLLSEQDAWVAEGCTSPVWERRSSIVVDVHVSAATDDALDIAADLTDDIRNALDGTTAWVQQFQQVENVSLRCFYSPDSDGLRGTARLEYTVRHERELGA